MNAIPRASLRQAAAYQKLDDNGSLGKAPSISAEYRSGAHSAAA
ncbi:hypothetical protein [Cupriavidus alkaliphilus]|uniref:Uncharacterized protein n=1 Tax=Cupriavidus alkaliphilus TaxID=942866 RepID=A0A7W4VFP3_9BURK|nr:hypothetical protein [Cupriavidus alkaliphilus]MBB3010766.1 hypothetical protein [Cupriavidus alkaliphilus]